MKTRFILSACIAALIPARPYGDCITLQAAQDFANRDTNRLQGNIMKVIARRSPYVNVLEGGTFPNGVSDTIRSVSQERAVSNQSLVAPNFIADTAVCGTAGPIMQVGSTVFTETLGTLRGRGPRVCVKTTRSAYIGSYQVAEDSMKKQIVQINNSDVRSTLVLRAGCKMVCQAGVDFFTSFDGDVNAVDTPFPNIGLPTTDLGFKRLKYARNFMKEDLLVDGWEGDAASNEPIFRVIASQEQIEKFRDEANVRDDHKVLTNGSFKSGEAFIKGYTWEGPYRGFAFGIDSQPLRFDTLDQNGQPFFIEPEYAKNVSTGVGGRINPAWARARFEVTLLLGMGSFRRRTPESLTGEAGFKWPAQLQQGEMEFAVIQDNDCNIFRDFGFHIYQITRSYRPEHPHFVLAIAHKRCLPDFGEVACSDYPGWSSTASL